MSHSVSYIYSGGQTLPRLKLQKEPFHAASRVTALAHATTSLGLSWRELLKSPSRVASEAHDLNTQHQQRALEYSLGYFLWDTLYVLCWEHNPMFIGHHVGVITFWAASLLSGRSGTPASFCLALGESSGPLFSLEWIFRKAGAQALQEVTAKLFSTTFLSARCIATPVYAVPLLKALFSNHIPQSTSKTQSRLQGFIIFGVCFGGFEWSRLLLQKIAREGGTRKLAGHE